MTAAAPGPVATLAATLAEAEAAILEASIVSFDIFDTVIIRGVAAPTELFWMMEHDLADTHPEVAGFAAARIEAEARARNQAWDRANQPEVTLEEVYALLPDRYRIFQAEELAFERRVCRVRESIARLVLRTRQCGALLVFTSDIYLPESHIADILRDAGLGPWDALFVSSSKLETKAAGGLYRILLEWAAERGVQPSGILHIGDNRNSDVLRAREAGIRSILVPKQIETPPAGSDASSLSVWNSVAYSLSRAHEEAAPMPYFERLGFEISGPLAAGFARFVHDTARARGVRDILFLARDGLIANLAFSRMFAKEIEAGEFRPQYVWASRRAFNFASMRRKITQHDMDFLVSGTTVQPAASFFRRIGLDPYAPDINPLIARHLPDLTALVSTGEMYERLRQAFLAAERQILAAAASERADLQAYLSSLGLTGSILAVDIGWHGSLQMSLEAHLRGTGFDGAVHGAYFGTHANLKCPEAASSWFLHRGEPSHRREIVLGSVEVIETLFLAPEEPIMRIARDGEQFSAVRYGGTPPKAIEAAAAIHRGAVKFLDAMNRQGRAVSAASIIDYVEHRLQTLLGQPSTSDVEHIGAIPFAEEFGHQVWHELIPTDTQGEIRLHGLFNVWGRSKWRPGLLHRLRPHQRAVLAARDHLDRLRVAVSGIGR